MIKTIKWKVILTILSLIATSLFASAQSVEEQTSQKNYTIKKLVVGENAPSANFMLIDVADSATKSPLPYATISAVNQKTKNSTFRSAGQLYVYNTSQFKDSIHIHVSQIGYKDADFTIKELEYPCLIKVWLSQSEQAIQEIIIRPNNKAAYVFNSDTIEFNVKRFKTLEGASLSDLLSKFPGISLSDKGLLFNGIIIEKITINKSSLFSNDLKAILKALKPEDITGFKVYKEVSDWDKENNIKHPQKHLVADISTKKAITKIKVGNFNANKAIYANHTPQWHNGTANFTTTKADSLHTFLIDPSLFSGATDSVGSTYFKLPVNYSRNRNKKGLSFNTKNNFSLQEFNNLSNSIGILQVDSDNIHEETSKDFSKNRNSSISSHTDITNNKGKKGILETTINLDYNTDDINSFHNTTKKYNNSFAINKTKLNNDNDKVKGQIYLNYRKNLSNINTLIKSTTRLRAQSANGTSSLIKDLTGVETHNDIKTRQQNIITDECLFINKDVGDYSFSIEGFINYSKDYSKRYSTNLESHSLDTISSHRTITYDLNHYIGLGIMRHFGNAYISANYTYSGDLVSLHEEIPQKEINKNRYDDNNFNAALSIPIGSFSQIHIKANRHQQLGGTLNNENINFSDLRGKIDDTDPLELKAFDKEIKIPTITNLYSTAEFVTNNIGIFNIKAQIGFTNNCISQNIITFTDTKYLEKYNYTVTPGIILKEYTNIGNATHIDISCAYDKYLSFIQNTFKFIYLSHYEFNPILVNGIRQKEKSNNNTFTIKLNSSFSKIFEYTLNYSASFSKTFLMDKETNSRQYRYGCNISLKPFKKASIHSNFMGVVNHSGIDGKRTFSPNFMLRAGYTIKLRDRHSLHLYLMGEQLFASDFMDETTLSGYLYNRTYTAQQGNVISFGISIK